MGNFNFWREENLIWVVYKNKIIKYVIAWVTVHVYIVLVVLIYTGPNLKSQDLENTWISSKATVEAQPFNQRSLPCQGGSSALTAWCESESKEAAYVKYVRVNASAVDILVFNMLH